MGDKIAEIRNKINTNINEAVKDTRHRPLTGVLG